MHNVTLDTQKRYHIRYLTIGNQINRLTILINYYTHWLKKQIAYFFVNYASEKKVDI